MGQTLRQEWQAMTMNHNYPEPDPAWSYYSIYQQTCLAHAKLEELLKYFASPDCEDAAPEIDRKIAQMLTQAQEAIASAKAKLE